MNVSIYADMNLNLLTIIFSKSLGIEVGFICLAKPCGDLVLRVVVFVGG